MKCRFYITEVVSDPAELQKLGYKEPVAFGDFFFLGENEQVLMEYKALSGGWGNGYLEFGNYEIRSMSTPDQMANNPNKDGYTLFDFGWFAALTPLFDTERTGLGAHPDGGAGTDGVSGYKGSLGCIVFPFVSKNDNIRAYNLFRDALEIKGVIPVTVMNFMHDPRIGK